MRSFVVILFAGALLLSAQLAALTVVPATFEELVRESVAVVHGRVRDVRADWSHDRRTIQSVVTLDVLDTLKGTVVDAATFVVPGGEVGGRLLVMPGAPMFHPGDEVVIFLAGRAPALPQPVGLSLGVYRVTPARAGASALVVPTPVHGAGAAGPVRRGSTARRPRGLAEFAADVRAIAGDR